ncbi:MAG TPA: hypothetical protein VF557_09585 [Jatrophihabitans sp.]|jgi:diaminopimelate decarboxylase|uniref:hypothetical protein n=1 Tax=Jatrophihabitans sp. TaxID=1932789 RepID=UPI002EEE0498
MTDPRHVVVSGVHSGPNPSSGLGIARSLRLADPGIKLTAVDYSPRSSGLHSDVFDDRVYLPSWSELDTTIWLEQILALVGDEGVFVPSLDLEVELLGSLQWSPERVLSPLACALDLCRKPPVEAARMMGLTTPAAVHDPDPEAFEEFLHTHGYDVWVKGPNYEAKHVHDLREALSHARSVQTRWGRGWHAEEHVAGQELALAFAARSGRLRGAALMIKLDTTESGKTWAGAVRPVPEELASRLDAFVTATSWNGGGEMEMIVDWEGRNVLLEVNPRFPAWIHGSSLCGFNLPALLVNLPPNSGSQASAFVRVVHEIAQQPALPMAAQQWKSDDNSTSIGKHPSGMPLLSRRRGVPPQRKHDARTWYTFSEDFATTLGRLKPEHAVPTPVRHLDLEFVETQVDRLRAALPPAAPTQIALSTKTNPDPRLLELAHRLGLWVDVITGDEYDLAVAAGFGSSDIVLNGPAKWWPARNEYACAAVFADSVPELRILLDQLRSGRIQVKAGVFGIRATSSALDSRFGETFDDSDSLAEAVPLIAEICHRLGSHWGLSFHHSQASIGTERWIETATSSLEVAAHFAERLGTAPALLDVGGGWRARDLRQYGIAVTELRRRLAGFLDAHTRLVVEPGRMLVEGAGTVLTTVLLVRDDGHVIVDASIAELPEAPAWPHPVAAWDEVAACWHPVGPGNQLILGRSCMEEDIVAKGLDLSAVATGSQLAIGRAGGYDTSMAYAFGRGRSS